MLSVYILTYNEELDIAQTIESAIEVGCDDIIVVDSYSSDRTVEIASSYPVRVVQHLFISHGQQRTWMLTNVATEYEWVYLLEADERLTPELFAECQQAIQSQQANRLLRRRTSHVYGQMDSLQHPVSPLPDAPACKKGTSGLPITVTPNEKSAMVRLVFLKKPILTIPVAKDYRAGWKSTIATQPTKQLKPRQLEEGSVNWRNLLWGASEVKRRRALKDLSLRLPFRPLLRWMYMYFGLGGILDGQAGFTWCTLQAFYEYLILLKVKELKRLPPPGSGTSQSLKNYHPFANSDFISAQYFSGQIKTDQQ